MSRPYCNTSGAELTALVDTHWNDRDTLSAILDELTHRRAVRMADLRARIEARIGALQPERAVNKVEALAKSLPVMALAAIGILLLVVIEAGGLLWLWATAAALAEGVQLLFVAALFRWRELQGWRHWYGLGGSITFALVLLRIVPPFGIWLWREVRLSWFGVLVGLPMVILTFSAIPMLGTVFIVVAWPIVLGWLTVDLYRKLRPHSKSN